MLARRFIFEGHVQGVGFRYAVMNISSAFEISGWVRNLPEGSVEVKVMGEVAEVEAFIKEIAEKSTVAHYIKSLKVETIPPMTRTLGFFIMPD